MPIVVQICNESRKVTQERFKRFAIDGRIELADCPMPYGYYNPKIDTLYFPREALFTGIALKFRPFRRIAIAINLSSNSYVLYPHPNTDFAAKTSDDRLHIRFVTTEDTIAPMKHILYDSVLPIAFPEPKPLTQARYPFYELTMDWISLVERYVEDVYGSVVTVGDMPPVSCACPGRFEEMKM